MTRGCCDARPFNPNVSVFCGGVGSYALWSVAYEQVLKPRTMLVETVIDYMVQPRKVPFRRPALVSPTETIETGWGWPAAGVRIGELYDGVELFALFALFILLSVLGKIGFHSLGILILHGATIGRVVVLARIQATSPEWLEFNHDYTSRSHLRTGLCAVVPLTVWGRPAHVNARRMTSQGSPQAGPAAGVGRGGWRCFWRC